MLGSTEWVEEKQEILFKKAVAYLNVDCFHGRKVFGQSSPAIAEFLMQTAKAIPNLIDCDHDTLFDMWMTQFEEQKATYEQRVAQGRPGTVEPPHPINILGSGTDYTPFFQHLGII